MKGKKALATVITCAVTAASLSGAGAYEVMADKGTTIQLVVAGNYQEFPEGLNENNNFIVDYWREKTGYDFDITILPAEEDASREKLNLMFNGGQIEGVVYCKETSVVSQFAEQGLLANLDDYVENNTLYINYPDVQKICSYDGSQYGIMIPDDGIFSQGAGTVVRKDLMEKNGITQQPKTFEELNDLLYMFKEEGLIGAALSGSPTKKPFDLFLSMFGISSSYASNFMLTDEGTLAYKMTSPQAKDYLTYMNQLYTDGIIPQDFASLDVTAVNEMYAGGQAGMVTNENVWQLPQLFASSEELGYDSRYLDYPTDYYGNTAYGDTYTDIGTGAFFISKDCPYLDEAMEFLNFLAEPETIMVNNYGIEGEHYNMENGIPVPTEAGSELAWAVYYRMVNPPENWYQVYGVGADWAEYYYPTERHTVGKEIYDLSLPISGEIITKRKELQKTIVDPYFTRVITGEESIDTFDDFVQEWLSAGGQEITDEYNRLFEENGKEAYIVQSYLPEEHPAYTGKYLFDGKLNE